MKALTIFNNIFFLGMLLMLSGLSNAAACGDPSPSKLAGNLFGKIQSRELKPSEYKDLDRLFRSLRGTKRGQADIVVCTGKDGLNKEIDKAKLNIEINYDSSGELDIITEVDSKKKTSREQLLLILKKDSLRMDNNNLSGDIEIVSITRDELVFNRRVVTVGRRSVQERVITLNKSGIHYLVYYRGMLASQSHWHF